MLFGGNKSKKNKPVSASEKGQTIGRTGESLEVKIDEETLKKALVDTADKEKIKEEKKIKEKTSSKEKKKSIFSFFKGSSTEEESFDTVYRQRGVVDRTMLVLILLLICFGCVMVFSASYAYALSKTGDSYFYIKKHLLYAAFGIAIMFGISFMDYRLIKKAAPFCFIGAMGLLGAVLVLGVAEGEAVRWLDLGFISFQPSEVMKLGLVLILAWYYSINEKRVRSKGFWKSSAFGTFIPLLILGAVCLLIALEKHISGTIIMFTIGFIVIWCAGGKKTWLLSMAAGFAGIVAAIISFTDYATKRLDIFYHPEKYSVQSEVWQTLQGKYAVGSGGLFGVGLGNSRQKHLFVSEPQNDFIFSIVCEELGFIGAVVVIGLFVAFFVRGIIIAKRAPDAFSKLTVIGIVTKVTVQAFLNIAVVTDTIPNTGVTLPFFSYGGTALLILLVEMGVLLSISRYSYLQKQ